MSFAFHQGQCVLATNASKQIKYECPDCNLPVFVRQGQIKRHHFAHYNDSKCDYYERTGEGHTHKSAKVFLKNQLENTKLRIETTCRSCKNMTHKEFEKFDRVVIEYPLKDRKRADVAGILGDKEIVFEVLVSHATLESAREGYEWYELLASDILLGTTTLMDHRIITCDACVCKAKELEERQRHYDSVYEEYRRDISNPHNQLEQKIEYSNNRHEVRRQQQLKYEEEYVKTWLEKQKKIDEDFNKKLEENEEKQRHYNSVYEEYIRDIVKPRNFDKDLKGNTFIYKGCDFLSPQHILRFNRSW
jgi:hypothetical protein